MNYAFNMNASNFSTFTRPNLSIVVLAVTLGACGGSGGGDAGDIARDGLEDQSPVVTARQLDDESCGADIDIAEFFLTEVDRQWACDISSIVGTRFDEIYFDRNGTANFSSTGNWYWNRNLPADEINLASPNESSAVMTDIGSANTLLLFRTINEAGVEENYDCVLTGRELEN